MTGNAHNFYTGHKYSGLSLLCSWGRIICWQCKGGEDRLDALDSLLDWFETVVKVIVARGIVNKALACMDYLFVIFSG